MRVSRLAAVALVLLAVPACSSNRGKIVGKWEYTGGNSPSLPPGTHMLLEFAADGTFTWAINSGLVSKTISGKYKLGLGDHVTLSDLSPPLANRTEHTEKVTIRGDQLTLKDNGPGNDTYLTFQRVK